MYNTRDQGTTPRTVLATSRSLNRTFQTMHNIPMYTPHDLYISHTK